MTVEQTVTAYLKDPKFLEYLELKGISPTESADVIYPHIETYNTLNNPIPNDGNLNV